MKRAPSPPLFFDDLYDTRQNNFNILRLWFAILVVFSHCFPILLPPPHGFEPLYTVSRENFTFGTLSVDAFFVISGFLISASWEHSKGLWDFGLRRVLRVFPGYLACLFVCAFLVGPLANGDTAGYFAGLQSHSLASILRLQNLPGVFVNSPLPRAVNGSLWTVRYEVYCYVLLALLGLTTRLKKPWVLAVFVFCFFAHNVLVPLCAARSVPLPLPLTEEYLPRLTTYFFAGGVFWAYRKQIPCAPSATLAAAVLFVIGLVVLPHALVPLAGTYCLMALAFSRRVRFYDFGKRFDFSYGVYLYAFPIQQLLAQRFLASFNPLTLFISVLPIIFFAAWCSWTFVEKPFLQIKKRTIARAQETTNPNPAA